MTRDLRSRDAARLWHPYTQHGVDRDPLPVAGARDAVLFLEDGRWKLAPQHVRVE